ncbi:MAG: hypothetical protein ABIW76_05630 [Fibrobacteria bacterium]
MPSIPTWMAILGLSLTPLSAQSEHDSNRVAPSLPTAKSVPQAASGNALVSTGTALAGVGLALLLAGYYPIVRLTGLGAFYVGIPVMGEGAVMLGRAAESVDSTYHRSNAGWGWFWTGLVLGGYGSYVFSESLGKADPGAVFGSAFMVIGGVACESMAWARFRNGIQSSRRTLRIRRDMTLQPVFLLPADGGIPAPGIRLGYRF